MAQIDVVEIATGKVASSVDVTGKTRNQIDRVERGMLINMDRARYFTRLSPGSPTGAAADGSGADGGGR